MQSGRQCGGGLYFYDCAVQWDDARRAYVGTHEKHVGLQFISSSRARAMLGIQILVNDEVQWQQEQIMQRYRASGKLSSLSVD